MFFRTIYSVKDFFVTIPPEGQMIFEYQKPKIKVVISHDPPEEYSNKSNEKSSKTFFCYGSMECEVNPKFKQIYSELLSNQPSVPQEEIECDVIGDQSRNKYNLDHYPKSFQDYSASKFSTLSQYIKRTVYVIRWRYNLPEQDINPFVNIRFEWSEDGDKWYPHPYSIRLTIHRIPWIDHSKISSEIIEEYINTNIDEPLGQELFREAWKEMQTHPRSAIIMGVVSLETSVKSLIVSLDSKTDWLISEFQSPPIIDILNNYIPILLDNHFFNGKKACFPKSTIEILREIISQRNAITHGKKTKVIYQNVVEKLAAIKDLLWILDYYRGEKWAINNVRGETIEDWE